MCSEGTGEPFRSQSYFNTMLDQSMDWKMAEQIRDDWGGTFCLKGVMSVADARRAVDIGVDAIMVSNHGGRQLDGSRAPFDQLPEIVDAVGGRIEVICDGGVRRGTHVLKALAAGANCASGGRLYLYALAAAGQAGVERAIALLQGRDRARHEADGRDQRRPTEPRTGCAGAKEPEKVNNKLIYLARRAEGVSREDWPSTWRSHAIFASQFPVLDPDIDWMRYCNRIEVEVPGISPAMTGSRSPSADGGDAERRRLLAKDQRARSTRTSCASSTC